MDKRRSTGHYSTSEGSSREHSRNNKKPRRIDNNETFLDASRDPRLNNDKYRAQMISSKSRVSPDTTMASKKSSKNDPDNVSSCQFCLKSVDNARLKEHWFTHHKNACFTCGLCPGQMTAIFDTIGKVRSHVEKEHSIDAKEIIDKLVKLPSPSNLRSFKCVACPATASASVGTSEEELRIHFKSKHKINAIKPFLIKRTCRICDKDSFANNEDIVRHIESDHPKSLFWAEEENDDDSKHDSEAYMPDEDELNYEPRSPSPPLPPARDAEASSIPEDGELSADESRRRSRKRSRSASTSSRSSRQSKMKPKPRQYRDSSSSSDDSRRKKRGGHSASPQRKVYVTPKAEASGSGRRSVSKGSKRNDESFFGVTYIPPAGYCQECDQRYAKGDHAQDHFKSRHHLNNVKSKYRCYFCNEYVQDTKNHLESRHRDMTFQCLLRGCNKPRFTQAAKVIDHVRCNHPSDFRKTRDDLDLFCQRMISMPKNIMSFACRDCKVVFHGDVKIAIVHLVLEHGRNVPELHHFTFSCRICGPKAHFESEKELEQHCNEHLALVKDSLQQPRRRSKSSDSRSYSRSQESRSPTPDAYKYGKNTLTCHYCPDQFRTLPVRKNHMLRDHEGLLFQCALCTFHNMYRRDLVWHLREHHRKDNFSDEVLIREFVRWPKDLRKIQCGKCTESEAHDCAVWLAVDPNDITKELKTHAAIRHDLHGKDVDAIYQLLCIGCNEKFDLDKDIKEWDDHMERQPCRQSGRRPRQSYSRSRSRSRSPPPPRRKAVAVQPVDIDLDKHCVFCCKEMDSSSQMDDHVRQRHLETAFVCRLCDTGNHHYEADLPAIKDHLKEDHGKGDLDNEEVKDYTRYPRDLICIKCNMCSLLCHAQQEEDLELHFKIFHEDCDFSTQHLDYLCRLCMLSGQNDSLKEVKDHINQDHPDEAKM